LGRLPAAEADSQLPNSFMTAHSYAGAAVCRKVGEL
jgi:hypothetical protein